MASVDEHLQRWREAGIIDATVTERIVEYERGQARAREAPGDGDRPGLLEALLYLGVAVIAVGAIALAGNNWDELEPWARIAVAGGPALFTLLAGLLMRFSDEPGVRRGGQVAWLVSVALVTVTAAITFDEFGGPDDGRPQLLGLGLIAAGTALVLWLVEPSHPQVVGLGGALFFLAETIGQWPDDYSSGLAGLCIFLFGAAGLVAAELDYLGPRSTGRAVFGLLFVAGPYHGGLDGPAVFEVLTFAAGGALISLSIWRGVFLYMFYGVGIVFVGLVTFIFEHFEDDLGAPFALMLSGVLVLVGVGVLTQFRSMARRRIA